MKTVGRIVDMDEPSGIGTVEAEHGQIHTTIFAEDCRAAGIAPVVGSRLIYTIGAHARTGNGAVGLEKLG
jgi:hypothetical protein